MDCRKSGCLISHFSLLQPLHRLQVQFFSRQIQQKIPYYFSLFSPIPTGMPRQYWVESTQQPVGIGLSLAQFELNPPKKFLPKISEKIKNKSKKFLISKSPKNHWIFPKSQDFLRNCLSFGKYLKKNRPGATSGRGPQSMFVCIPERYQY